VDWKNGELWDDSSQADERQTFLKQLLAHNHCKEPDNSDTSIDRNAGAKSGNVHSGFTDILRQQDDWR